MNDISKAYNSTSLKANYLISTGLSNAGAIFCNYGSQNRYTHGKSIAAYETIETSATTMSPLGSKYGWKLRTWVYGSGRYLLPRVPYLFEYSDPVQAIGFTHSLFVVASGDEALLNRAEAYIMKKDYPAALADMNMWAAEPAHRLLLQRTDRRVDQQMGRCPGLRHDAQGSRKTRGRP